ncbi:MAG: hypothetical protein KGN01_05555 [Patescibacteria group bacterium]|nr:hypothetical protein [Patescibacteria group bacterium]
MAKEALTTGQISNYCCVAPRTVSKWIDSGRLKGFRLPGSMDRRVLIEDLVKFCNSFGYPAPAIINGHLVRSGKVYAFGLEKQQDDFVHFDDDLVMLEQIKLETPKIVLIKNHPKLVRTLEAFSVNVCDVTDLTRNEIMKVAGVI